jgi:Ca2+/H+ antiporter
VTGFVVIGAIFLIGGLAVLITGIRHQREQRPRYAAMLIGGMMATAFGLVLGGFAIAYNAAAPLDLNASGEGVR